MDIENTKWIKDYLYYDGPLISLFKENEREIIAVALLPSHEYERYALINCAEEAIQSFENSNVDLLEVFKMSDGITIIESNDVYETKSWLNIQKIVFEQMKIEDLPDSGLYI